MARRVTTAAIASRAQLWLTLAVVLAAWPVTVLADDRSDSEAARPPQLAAAAPGGREDGANQPLHRARPDVAPDLPKIHSAGVTPAGVAPLPDPSAESKNWLVIVIQATLAEKGCYRGPINGQWDAATQDATDKLGKSGNFLVPTSAPSDLLLQDIRSASVTLCKNPLVTNPNDKNALHKAKAAGPRERAPRAQSRRAGGYAQRGGSSPGPAVFVRPVGGARF